MKIKKVSFGLTNDVYLGLLILALKGTKIKRIRIISMNLRKMLIVINSKGMYYLQVISMPEQAIYKIQLIIVSTLIRKMTQLIAIQIHMLCP